MLIWFLIIGTLIFYIVHYILSFLLYWAKTYWKVFKIQNISALEFYSMQSVVTHHHILQFENFSPPPVLLNFSSRKMSWCLKFSHGYFLPFGFLKRYKYLSRRINISDYIQQIKLDSVDAVWTYQVFYFWQVNRSRRQNQMEKAAGMMKDPRRVYGKGPQRWVFLLPNFNYPCLWHLIQAC